MHKGSLSAVHLCVHYKHITSVLATEYKMVLAQSSERLTSVCCSVSLTNALCSQNLHSVQGQATNCIVVWVTTRYTVS